MPDLDTLSRQAEYSKSEILQIYIRGVAGETHRIRRRVFEGTTVYTETRKIRIDKISAREIEGVISESRFFELAAEILDGTRPINKIRHTFVYEYQLFEIDVYPDWQKTAIMETELDSREKTVAPPSFLTVLREVTGERAYSNAAMSREFPREII